MNLLDYFALVCLVLAVIGVTTDIAEHRRLSRGGVKPRIEGPWR